MSVFEPFGLNGNPFSETVDEGSILEDGRFQTSMDPLLMLPEVGSMATLTGRTGVGKTTLVRRLMSRWQVVNDVHYLHLGNLKSTGLLRSLLTTLGERPSLGKDRMFGQLYAHLARKQRSLCLVIDEAQLLDPVTMTDLRVLCANPDIPHRLVLLLCGQPMLGRLLQAESLTDLRERMCMEVHLPSMQASETMAYVIHRLREAGGDGETFDEAALKMLHRHSEGVPRRVHQVAIKAMMNALSSGKDTVDEKILRQACAAERS